jgi:hypothetical protein
MKNLDNNPKTPNEKQPDRNTRLDKSRPRISADKLFTLFTASIIKKRTKFTR